MLHANVMWSPLFILQYVVECCLRLLSEPNGESPLNAELGILLRVGDSSDYNELLDYYLNYIHPNDRTYMAYLIGSSLLLSVIYIYAYIVI